MYIFTLIYILGIVLFTNMVVGNTLELFIPYMKEVTRRQLGGVKIEESKDPSIQLREAMQEQFTSEPYDDTSLLGDYMETVLLFGYIVRKVFLLSYKSIVVLSYLRYYLCLFHVLLDDVCKCSSGSHDYCVCVIVDGSTSRCMEDGMSVYLFIYLFIFILTSILILYLLTQLFAIRITWFVDRGLVGQKILAHGKIS